MSLGATRIDAKLPLGIPTSLPALVPHPCFSSSGDSPAQGPGRTCCEVGLGWLLLHRQGERLGGRVLGRKGDSRGGRR